MLTLRVIPGWDAMFLDILSNEFITQLPLVKQAEICGAAYNVHGLVQAGTNKTIETLDARKTSRLKQAEAASCAVRRSCSMYRELAWRKHDSESPRDTTDGHS